MPVFGVRWGPSASKGPKPFAGVVDGKVHCTSGGAQGAEAVVQAGVVDHRSNLFDTVARLSNHMGRWSLEPAFVATPFRSPSSHRDM